MLIAAGVMMAAAPPRPADAHRTGQPFTAPDGILACLYPYLALGVWAVTLRLAAPRPVAMAPAQPVWRRCWAFWRQPAADAILLLAAIRLADRLTGPAAPAIWPIITAGFLMLLATRLTGTET